MRRRRDEAELWRGLREPSGTIEPPVRPTPAEPPADGTPAGQSSTIWSAIGGIATAVVGTLADLNPIVQGLLVVGAIGFGVWIIRERLRRSRDDGI